MSICPFSPILTVPFNRIHISLILELHESSQRFLLLPSKISLRNMGGLQKGIQELYATGRRCRGNRRCRRSRIDM